MLGDILPKGDHKVTPGQFGLLRWGRFKYGELRPAFVEWYNCRDSFQSQWHARWNDSLFYVCNKDHVEEFLKYAEKSLGLWCKTKLYNSNFKGICTIVPSEFWKESRLRMSLFTILLRAALRYKPGMNWRETLFEYPYAYETKEAIAYFFAGHTVSIGNTSSGWHQKFAYEHPPLNKLLQRPLASKVYRWIKGLFIKKG